MRPQVTGAHFDPMDRLLRHPLHYTTELKRAKKVRGFRQDAACEATWWEFASLAFRRDKWIAAHAAAITQGMRGTGPERKLRAMRVKFSHLGIWVRLASIG